MVSTDPPALSGREKRPRQQHRGSLPLFRAVCTAFVGQAHQDGSMGGPDMGLIPTQATV